MSACSMSSNPTTERSSGTRSPRSRAARNAPIAMLSLNAKIAVGGSGRSSRAPRGLAAGRDLEIRLDLERRIGRMPAAASAAW